jgi:predicted nucleic acid-binding protein
VPSASDRGQPVAYLDSSALVKLVIDEPETDALTQALRSWPRRASSRLCVVEVLRAVRSRRPDAEPCAHRVLGRTALLRVNDAVIRAAVAATPLSLASLDAVHVASASRIKGQLGAFVSYDERQLDAARERGLPTASPR